MKKILIFVTLFSGLTHAQNITTTTINPSLTNDSNEISDIPVPKYDIESPLQPLNENFPFHSEGMVLGEFETYNIKNNSNFNLERPICVVGYDDYSIQWIQQYKEELKASEAVCLITNIKNERELSVFTNIDPELIFAPADVEWIPQFLHVTKYPVFITNEVVFQ